MGFHGTSVWSFNFHVAIMASPPSWAGMRHRCILGKEVIDR